MKNRNRRSEIEHDIWMIHHAFDMLIIKKVVERFNPVWPNSTAWYSILRSHKVK